MTGQGWSMVTNGKLSVLRLSFHRMCDNWECEYFNGIDSMSNKCFSHADGAI